MRNLIAIAVALACASTAQAKTEHHHHHEDVMRAVRVDAQAARDAIAHHELKVARRHVDDALELVKHDAVPDVVKRDLIVARASLAGHKAQRADHALSLVELAIAVR